MICTVCKKVHAERYSCCKACRHNSRTWKAKHWEKNLLCTHRIRDVRAGIYDPVNFVTKEHIQAIRRELGGKCFHCHVQMDAENRDLPDGLTLQRLDNRLGHTIQNTTLACLSCNRHRVESCNTGWLEFRRGQVEFDKLVEGGYQNLTRRMHRLP